MRRSHLLLALGAVALVAVGLAAGLLIAGGEDPLRRTVLVNQSQTDAAADKDVQVFCPKGWSPVSGGGLVPHGNDTPGVALYWSAPYANGWEVAAQDTRRRTRPWVLTAYVVCVQPATDVTGLPGSTLTVE